ncbi:hypothetical protein KFL_006030020 [Klebsormidium nitens]|uniref:FAM192A/Fyv6 N-terminal domain-containing protein n=1 Tax=Klebsormidium nitens TaxID=105231 RepID=A0A1Y1IL09_KLENI|nr:hypothetical protein KFL_006030020 [Klebsormidium nitens]|eukprot:GAQ90119.1 hypothetical protein KFL_006030020 [Klebsormidium nitens]
MGDEGRMMNFVSEKQLDELKAARGGRPEDGTVAVDKPLWEILKANKEVKDAEWTEKHRHKTQKALDEDEVHFLDAVDLHQREQEKLQRDAEAQELASFQAALLEKQLGTEITPVQKQRSLKGGEPVKMVKRPAEKPLAVLASMVKLKPQPKKLKAEQVDTGSLRQVRGELEKDGQALREQTVQSGLLGLQDYKDDDDEDSENEEGPS